MNDMPSITLHYNEHLVRSTVRAFWWKQLGPGLLAICGVLTTYTVHLVLSGDRSWLTGALGACLVLSIAAIAASYVAHIRASLGRLRRMPTPRATLVLNEDSFSVTSDLASTEIAWCMIQSVWRFEQAWIVVFDGKAFMTIPTSSLPQEAKNMIISKVKKHGATIK